MAPLYSFRPSKAVTRAMLVDRLRKVVGLAEPADYQYIGFGALEFVDFDLIHRRLGIKSMASIEAAAHAIERYKNNRPFNGIDILVGRASDALTGIDWSRLSIVWLDYTQCLKEEFIADVQYLARKLIPGSVIAITLNAHPATQIDTRRNLLAERVGEERVPVGTTDFTLGQWGLAAAQHRILSDILNSTFGDRSDSASWNQFMNIQYRDDARMQLIAGVVGAPAMSRALDQLDLLSQAWTSSDASAHVVQVPYLTPKEVRQINEQLPRAPRRVIRVPGLKAKDFSGYTDVYRWLEPQDLRA